MNRERRLRLLMVSTLFPPEYAGGGGQALALGQNLVSRGVRVVALAGTNLTGPSSVYQTDMGSIPIFRVHRSRSSCLLGNCIYLIRFLITMIRLVLRSDIVHFYGTRLYPLLGVPIAKVFRRRTVGTITLMGTDDPVTLAHRPLGFFRMLVLKRIDAWVGLTSEAKQACVSAGISSSKISKIPIGIDCDIFRPAPNQEKEEIRRRIGLPHRNLVVFAGIISYRKGIDLLIEAIPSVHEHRSDVLFILVGPHIKAENPCVDSVLTERLKALSVTIPNRVMLAGFVDNPLDFFRVATVFVLPSRREGLSVALLEAMSVGIPTVVTNHPWLVDVGVNSIHFLEFEAESSEGLARGIITLLDDEKARVEMSHAARECIEEKFSMHLVASQYLELYGNILADGLR